MSQSLPYITSASQVPEDASMLDLRTHLDHKCTEATRNRELHERYREERNTERAAHKATKSDAKKQAKEKDQEVSSIKAELKKQSEKIEQLEGEANLRRRGAQDPLAFEMACSANKADRLEADLVLKETERNELVKPNTQAVDSLKCARMNIKTGMDDMAQTKASSDAKSAEMAELKLKLKESEAQRGMLAQQIEKLVDTKEKLMKERNEAVADAKKAKEDAATRRSHMQEMLMELDHQSKRNTAKFGQFRKYVKTIVEAKNADIKERDREIGLLNKQMEELLLENTELREEVRLHKDDSGVIALDSESD